MRILFEGYKYQTKDVENALSGLLSKIDLSQTEQQLKCVGYYYDKNAVNADGTIGDLVFILPKVLLDKENKAFGLAPNDLINFNLKEWNVENETVGNLTKKKIHDFIYGFSSWLYRAIDVYRKNKVKEDKIDDEEAEAKVRSSLEIGKGGQKHNVTFFDILLSLVDFQKQHRNFITFIIKMSHSGFNKVSWPKTIARTQAVVQDESPIYLNPINKQRVINFDEELLIIYFSILNYIHEYYGVPIPPNQPGYKLIIGAKFNSYLNGQGKARLHKIRYKYYSDEAILLWNLCNNFFEKYDSLRTQPNKGDYLFVNKFEVVFEAMIDELIGDKDLPEDLKVHRDDKRIDHLYTYKYLIENLDSNTDLMTRDIYNIADSKYYKRDKELRGHDIPKQFTYARNVIQWHMDLLHGLLKDDKKAEKYKDVKMFDEVTEGYNIIPNFFISGFVNDNLSYSDPGLNFSTLGNNIKNPQESFFFWERLFDRNTFFTMHYDVNFLYVMKMYAQNKTNVKEAWKIVVRQEFRKKTLDILKENFYFHQIIVPYDDNAEITDDNLIKSFVNKYFRQLLGKVFCFDDADGNRVLLYAERKTQKDGNGKSFEYVEDKCTHVENGILYIPTNEGVDQYKVIKVELGASKYRNSNYAIVGYIKSDAQYKWIMENGIYNIPTTLRGKYQKLDNGMQLPSFLILRNEKLENFVFDVVGKPIVKTKKEDLPKGDYVPGHPEYYIFTIDVNKRNDEVLETFAESKYCKKLKKKSFAVNLSQLQLEAETAVETSSEPMKALLYKFEDKDVFYSMVAEGDVEYGDLD
ncbi:MAG: LlaJI family restriction endonuclease [Bacteroidales bacterium]|nr:LlaJI family restriction endonuclease [Bacteroidales bacterium]